MYESAELGSTDGDDNVLTYCMQTWKKRTIEPNIGQTFEGSEEKKEK